MIPTSTGDFAEWGTISSDSIVAAARLDALLFSADMFQIERPSYRSRAHVDPLPENFRMKASIQHTPILPTHWRRRPSPNKSGRSAILRPIASPTTLGNFRLQLLGTLRASLTDNFPSLLSVVAFLFRLRKIITIKPGFVGKNGRLSGL